MKKFTLLFALLMAMSVSAKTQQFSKWSVTPRLGMNISNVVGGKAPGTDSKVGITGGVDAEYRPIKYLGLSLGCYYATMNSKVDLTEIFQTNLGRLESHYHSITTGKLLVPLMLNVHIYKGLTAKIGAQGNLMLSAKAKSRITGYEIIPDQQPSDQPILGEGTEEIEGTKVPMDESHSLSVKNSYNKSTLSMPVALAYEYKNIELEVRYNIGSYGLSSAGYTDTNKSLTITLGYRFGL